MKRYATVLAGCFAVTIICFVPLARAAMSASGSARTGYSEGPPASPGGQQTVDDATLKKAAHIFTKVRSINVDTTRKVQQATDQQEKRKIMQNARSRELLALQQEGLSPAQYNAVLGKVEADPALNAKFSMYVSRSAQPASRE